MKIILSSACLAALLFGASIAAMAGNDWVGYTSKDTYKRPLPPRPLQQHYPQRPLPPVHHYPNRPVLQNGVSIQYQAPTTIYQNSNSYSWVNGDPNVAHIESSRYVLINDWRRLGLPDPPAGMHWIFENGRYVLVNNR
ncbi:hypothetical protein BS636_02445 [Acinetobacter sp. LoGeW2-3]|uniref:RcnB family protein n=1 Tax=Acinetobacter sp. LoGeW2-3 TaxID=1808001 RepID=UPI000C05CA5A|nr:RcnB family protein [Acinetobacter sp. LoGeW2-3]ATO18602.1 hypothetical protein BS636_02445 [Acinetobacter sp. LoGeW2-3]